MARVHNCSLDIMELSNPVTVEVKFRRMREWTLRVRIASLILRFGFWILPFAVEIDKEQ